MLEIRLARGVRQPNRRDRQAQSRFRAGKDAGGTSWKQTRELQWQPGEIYSPLQQGNVVLALAKS